MTVQLEQALADAGLALLRADAGLTVWPDASGVVPDLLVPPCVRVHADIQWPEGADGNALDGLSTGATVRWYCHCVGANDIAARAVAARVRMALLDQRPVIAGRVVGLIRQESASPPALLEWAGGQQAVTAVLVFRLDTQPG